MVCALFTQFDAPKQWVPDGESDFVLIGPEIGLLVLEVKGGGISRNDTGEWLSEDRGWRRACDHESGRTGSKKNMRYRHFLICPASET